MEKPEQLIHYFNIGTEGRVVAKPLGNGLINDTYKVEIQEENGSVKSYVLQRINHHIFQDVEGMQNNIKRITDHIRTKLLARGEKDTDRKTLTLIETKEGKLYHFTGTEYWRLTLYITDSRTYDSVTPDFAYLTGKAFGDFQSMLTDLPGAPLGYTIPHFHNMEFRLEQFKEAIRQNPANRLQSRQPVNNKGILTQTAVSGIVHELLQRGGEMCRAEHLGREGKLPRRITHCDTKVNNMLFDQQDQFLCVIDLDTTMPGFVLSDFGDFIRTAGNTGAEDEQDISKVALNTGIFNSFAKGYIEGTRDFLTPIEKENLTYGAKLLTYMQTVRFLTDYLNGDTYYKIKYPNHNWDRTMAQFTLLRSIEAHEDALNKYIAGL